MRVGAQLGQVPSAAWEKRPVPPAAPGWAAQLSCASRHCQRQRDKPSQQEGVSPELPDP